MAKNRVLFFPWWIGAGHTGRSLVVAHELRKAEHTCVFAFDPTNGHVEREGFPVIGVHHKSIQGFEQVYLSMLNLDMVMASNGFYREAVIRQELQETRSIVDKVKPEVIITHMNPFASIIAAQYQIPLVSIAESDFLDPSPHSWTPWVTSKRLDRLNPFPPALKAFNNILTELGLRTVSNITELMWGDLTLVANISLLEPLSVTLLSEHPQTHYVGPLIWHPSYINIGRVLESIVVDERIKVYVTLGSGGLTSKQDFHTIVDALLDLGVAVFIATGYDFDFQSLANQYPNVSVQELGGMTQALAWADIVIHHGGHSTTLAALLAGKAALVLPSFSENEANAYNMLHKHQAGLLLRRSQFDDQRGRLRFKTLDSQSNWTGAISKQDVIRGVHRLRKSKTFANQAQYLQQQLEQGSQKALIPSLIRAAV